MLPPGEVRLNNVEALVMHVKLIIFYYFVQYVGKVEKYWKVSAAAARVCTEGCQELPKPWRMLV